MNQHTVSAKEYLQYMHFKVSHLNYLGTEIPNAKRKGHLMSSIRSEALKSVCTLTQCYVTKIAELSMTPYIQSRLYVSISFPMN